ncbi:hypothetical protein HOY80DRAFT_1030132 [Tuber brumale]|nr:hypothetical protein HOY80DRAFT_1030132 [Tuber brumale]
MQTWVVPKIPGKPEFTDARKSGCGDLLALGAKSRTRWNVNIEGYNQTLVSKLIGIMDPHGDGASEEAGARKRHAEMVSEHKVEKGRRLQEKAMAEQEARKINKKVVPMHREGTVRKKREMQMRKKE